jgi:hypothetical protein
MLAEVPVNQVAGPIAMAIAASIGVTLQRHWIFDVAPAANAPAGAPVQRRKTSTTANRLVTNQTSLAHSVSPFTRTRRGCHDLSAAPTAKPAILAISSAPDRRWPR